MDIFERTLELLGEIFPTSSSLEPVTTRQSNLEIATSNTQHSWHNRSTHLISVKMLRRNRLQTEKPRQPLQELAELDCTIRKHATMLNTNSREPNKPIFKPSRMCYHDQVQFSGISDPIQAFNFINSFIGRITFTRFPKLPTELRLEILQQATILTTSRIVELYITNANAVSKIRPIIAMPQSSKENLENIRLSASPRTVRPSHLSAVNRETHLAVLDTHNFRFHMQKDALLPANYQGSLNFDPDRDILYLNSEIVQRSVMIAQLLRLFISATPPAVLDRIRVLAINCNWYYQDLPEELEKLVNLELVILVMGNGLPQEALPEELFLADVTPCERAYFATRFYDSKAFNARLEGPRKRKASMNIRKRKLWLAHVGSDIRASHCCYGGQRRDRIYHRHHHTDVWSTTNEGSIDRRVLKFSDDSRQVDWWRREKWCGSLELKDNGLIDYWD